jgi:hypothetical protein
MTHISAMVRQKTHIGHNQKQFEVGLQGIVPDSYIKIWICNSSMNRVIRQ